jgi:endonuclease/exonuclease/phosphatase family metal-dependent hydrolase
MSHSAPARVSVTNSRKDLCSEIDSSQMGIAFDLSSFAHHDSLMKLSRCFAFVSAFLFVAAIHAERFRISTYNVENYLDAPVEGRDVKKAESRAKVRESILAMKPDIIALQEMGTTNALLELRDALKKDGLDLPYWEHVQGQDPSIHVAILSRFPFTAKHPHTNENFLLNGKRFQVSRGFADVDIRINDKYSFSLITAHLKSRRPVPIADEAELREQEAILLREKIDEHLEKDPNANLIVLGDFNDIRDSKGVRAVLGRGKTKLVDTRPAERNGDNLPNAIPRYDPRNVTWTHFYGKEDTYSRIDYLLLSPGMARESVREETYIATIPNWGLGSDHRPLTATFEAEER